MDDYTYLARRIKCRHPFCDSCVGCGDIDEFVFDYQNWRLFFDADDKPKTTVRLACERMIRPVWHSESNAAIYFAIGVLVVKKSMNTFPITGIADYFLMPTMCLKLQLERLRRTCIDLFNALNPMVLSILRQLCWLWRYQ